MQSTSTVLPKLDLDVDPPPYPGLSPPSPQYQSIFCIPSFEDVMTLSQFEDSMRLPTYQSRYLARYHPYWRLRPNRAPPPDETRYFNTVYDSEYVPLQVPPAIIRAPVAAAQADHFAPPVQNVREPVRDLEEEYRQRVHRLRVIIAKLILTVGRVAESEPEGLVAAPAEVEMNDPAPAPAADSNE